MAEGPGERVDRFSCSPSPARRRGRRRLAALLVALALAATGAALYAWSAGRVWPAVLAVLAALFPLLAWRMSGDLDPVELWLGGGRITVRTRRHLMRWPVAGAAARRLDDEEIDHLRRLSASAGFLTSAGGFDSHRLGEFDLYASDLERAVLLDLGEERLVITPDDPEAFLEAFQNAR